MNKEETIKLFKQDTVPCYSSKGEKGILRLFNQSGEGSAYSDDKLTIYCENRNAAKASGGEDSYPVAEDYFLLEADGVGNSSCHHEILDAKGIDARALVRKVYNVTEDCVGRNKQVYDYAVGKSFVPSPPNLFYFSQYASEPFPYTEASLGKRSSAFLGSRLVSVGVYQHFSNFVVDQNITDWFAKPEDGAYAEKYPQACWGEILTSEIERYINCGLREKLVDGSDPLFSYTGADIDSIRRERYFLATTLACTFFPLNSGNDNVNEVNALVVWIGDARCYKVDAVDGVKCLTRDDALPNSKSMSGFVSFGQHPSVTGNYKDNKFNSRVVCVKKPCAFFVCSDGVYDTCPTIQSSRNPTEPQNDTEFECKMLRVLRNANSMDDVYYGLAYSFYFGTDYWKTFPSQYCISNIKENIKADDSGTLALKAFWTKNCRFFSDMLSGETTLDRFNSLITRGIIHYEEAAGDIIKAGARKPDAFEAFANAVFPFSAKIIALFCEISDKIFKTGEFSSIFGADENKVKYIYNLLRRRETVDKREGKSPVNRFVNNNFATILGEAVAEYNAINIVGLPDGQNPDDYFADVAKHNKTAPDYVFDNSESFEAFCTAFEELLENGAFNDLYQALFFTAEEEATAAANPLTVAANLYELANKVGFAYYNGTDSYYRSGSAACGSLRDEKLISSLQKLDPLAADFDEKRIALRATALSEDK